MGECELSNPCCKARPTSECLRGMRQRGLALYVVMVLLLLTAILALWASRAAIFSEMVTGNDADYQRAFEAAQAMVQDAKDDIHRNLFDPGKASTRASTGKLQFPGAQSDFSQWALPLQSTPMKCQNGICLRRTDATNFWEDDSQLAAMLAVGARYGAYSGARKGTHTNPILLQTAANKGAWYWVEPMPFKGSEIGNTSALVKGTGTVTVEADMLFHITAIAIGIKGASQNDDDIAKRSPTMAVIQTLVALPVNKGE